MEADLNYSGQRARMQASCPGEVCNPALVGIVGDPSVLAISEQGQKLGGSRRCAADWVQRLPYALAYVTGGLAVGEVMTAGTVFGFDGDGNPVNTIVSSHNTKAGWTVGGGIEAPGGNWTAKLEYLYLDLDRSRQCRRPPRIPPWRSPSIPASPTTSCARASTTSSIPTRSGQLLTARKDHFLRRNRAGARDSDDENSHRFSAAATLALRPRPCRPPRMRAVPAASVNRHPMPPGYVYYPAYGQQLPGPNCYWFRVPVYDAYGNMVSWRGRPVGFCSWLAGFRPAYPL